MTNKIIDQVTLGEYNLTGKPAEEMVTKLLTDFPGCTSSQVIGATGLPYSTVWAVVQRMGKAGKLTMDKTGQQTRVYLAQPVAVS